MDVAAERSICQFQGNERPSSWGLVRPETMRSSTSVSHAKGSIPSSCKSFVLKTLGYCWRSHDKATSAACTSDYGWASKDFDLYRWLQRFAPEFEKRVPWHLYSCRGPGTSAGPVSRGCCSSAARRWSVDLRPAAVPVFVITESRTHTAMR